MCLCRGGERGVLAFRTCWMGRASVHLHLHPCVVPLKIVYAVFDGRASSACGCARYARMVNCVQVLSELGGGGGQL